MSKSKNKKQIVVTILYGLPGSGKTFFAQGLGDHVKIIDFDSIIKSIGSNKFAVMIELGKQVRATADNLRRTYMCKNQSIVIDGLITTNQQLRDMIDYLTAHITQYQLVFQLVYWNEDRGACLHNDKNRREVSSQISIKSLPYEKLNFNLFPEFSIKRIKSMKVVRKEDSSINV